MFQVVFFNVPLTSNAFTRNANHYSIVDNKGGVGILVALQAKHLKNTAYK